jgi:hypothetical protein
MLKSLYRQHQKTVIKNWFHPITMYIPTAHAPKTAKRGASAGIGVYFGEGDPRNISRRIEGN